MKLLRIVLGSLAAVAGLAVLLAGAYTLANHVFEWRPDKVSAEWQASARVALARVIAAAFPLGVSLVALTANARKGVALAAACAVAVVWMLACVLAARLNAGYLWLFIGLPVATGYVALRAMQHRRAPAA